VPFVALIPTVFAFIFAKTQNNKSRILSIVFILIYLGYEVHLISKTIQKNNLEDRKAKEASIKHQAFQKQLADQKHIDPLKFQDYLINIEKNTPPRELILAILETKECPPELLSKYSRSNDLGLTLTVAQNNLTPSTDLEYIFYNSSYPSYFYSSLARNTNTPPNILKELYNLKEKNTLIVPNLMNNPNTPKEILENINN